MVIWPGNVLHCESITVIISSDFDLEQLSLYRMLYRYGTDVHFRVTPMRYEVWVCHLAFSEDWENF